MAKIELKGIVKKVTSPEIVGNNNTKKQSVILFIPARTNEFNELIAPEEQWCLDLFNSKIENLKLDGSWHEKKVKATVYVSSRKVEKDDGSILYIVNSNLGAIEKIVENTQPRQQATTTANDDNW